MPKYPFMTRRKGSRNLYYKRPVPRDLQVDGRPKQIWRSLATNDEREARAAYRIAEIETDHQFEQWRRDDNQPSEPCAATPLPENAPKTTPLSPALLRRLADTYYLSIYDADFGDRVPSH